MEKEGSAAKKILSAMEKLIQIQRILLWDVAKIEGLSPIQIQFIIYLGRYRENLCTVSVLAREFDLTKATVSDAINTLVSKGMASKNRGGFDRRSYIIRLTAKGRSALKRIENWQDRLLERINSFSDEEKDSALMFFMKLIKLFYDDGIISMARMCITCENYTRISEDDTGDHYCRLTGETLARGDLSLGCENYTSGRDR
jgi:DNA-binding MarR family transcriptional regulator